MSLSLPGDEHLFVAVSSFEVANDKDHDVATAFRARPHLVDEADGFVRMEVLRGQENPKEFWLITYWRNEQSFETWHKSHLYSDSHRGIPPGLKLVKRSARVRRFARIAE